MARALLAALLLLVAAAASGADREIGLSVGRGTESADTDIVRLTYRRALPENERWWMPTHIQLGASVWRVPDIRGQTRRFDVNATPIWRSDKPWGYLEGGIGLYLLSKTINNDENRVPSSLEFGSHIGAGLRLGQSSTIGVAYQHLSNAGIKQPNGGIDLILIQYQYAFSR